MMKFIRAHLHTLYLSLGTLLLIALTLPVYFTNKRGYGFSDALFLEQFTTDLIEHGGKWLSWSMTGAPAYVPDVFLYFLSYPIFHYAMDRIFFVCVAQAAIMVWAHEYLVRPLLSRRSYNLSFVLLLMMGGISYLSYTTGEWMYFNSTNNHIGSYILTIFSVGLLLRILSGDRRSHYIWLALITLAGTLSGQMFLVWFVAPALLTLMGYAILRMRPLRLLARPIATLIIATAFTKSIQPLVTPWDTLNMWGRYTIFSWLEASKAFTDFWDILYQQVSAGNIVFNIFVLCWFWGALLSLFMLIKFMLIAYFRRYTSHAMPVSASHALLSIDPAFPVGHIERLYQFLIGFIWVHLIVNFVAIIGTGNFFEVMTYRYFMPSILLPICFLLATTSHYFRFAEGRVIALSLSAIASLLLILSVWNFDALKERKINIAQIRNFEGSWEKVLASCIDAHKEEYDLQFGLANFWVARPMTLMSQKGLRVYPTKFASIIPRHFMSNIDWFRGDNGHTFAHPLYNFYILSAEDNPLIVTNVMGPPPSQFKCLQTIIYVYPPSTGFDAKMKAIINAVVEGYYFSNGFRNDITFPAIALLSQTGRYSDKGFTATEGKDKPGMLTYGTDINLTASTYHFSIEYSASGLKTGESLGTWDVLVTPDLVVARGDIPMPAEGKGTIEGNITIPASYSKHLSEIRTFYNGTGSITISSVSVKRK